MKVVKSIEESIVLIKNASEESENEKKESK